MKRVIAVLAGIVVLSACPESHTPARETARAAVLATAEAVRLVGEECERIVRQDEDLELGRICVKGYDTARIALIGTSGQVDAWDKYADHEPTICSVTRAIDALEPALFALEERMGQPLPIGRDARQLIAMLGPCKRSLIGELTDGGQ